MPGLRRADRTAIRYLLEMRDQSRRQQSAGRTRPKAGEDASEELADDLAAALAGMPQPRLTPRRLDDADEAPADAIPTSRAPRLPALCGSDRIIAGVNVVSFAAEEQTVGRLELMAVEDHERLLFMGRQARLTADVCANCGHVELRAENVRGLACQRREP